MSIAKSEGYFVKKGPESIAKLPNDIFFFLHYCYTHIYFLTVVFYMIKIFNNTYGVFFDYNELTFSEIIDYNILRLKTH